MQFTDNELALMQKRISAAIQRVFSLFGIHADIQAVSYNPEQYIWDWAIKNTSGQEMYGQVRAWAEYREESLNLQIASAIAIGLHPMNRVITEMMNGYQDNVRFLENGQPDIKRNSILEIILRRSIDGVINMGVKKSAARSYILKIINFDRNIEEKYTAKAQKKATLN